MRVGRLGPPILAVVLAACGLLPTADRMTIMVRNRSDEPVMLEITESSRQAIDPLDMPRIADPITVGPNAVEAVTFVAPAAQWSLRRTGSGAYFDSEDLHDWARQLESGEISSFVLVIQQNGELFVETTE